jgi:predicted transcriptional regulator
LNFVGTFYISTDLPVSSQAHTRAHAFGMTIKEMPMPQKRAPGGGRKPRGEYRGNSKILTVRVTPELRTALERLADKHHRSLSQEMQRGLDKWVGRNLDRKPHVAALAHALTRVVEAVERATGKSWHEDAFTGEALRHGVEHLIFHFAPTPDRTMPLPVPPRVEEAAMRMPPDMREKFCTAAMVGTFQASMVIGSIEYLAANNSQPGPATPRDKWGDDEWRIWQILRDLGSGWEKNREARIPKETRK